MGRGRGKGGGGAEKSHISGLPFSVWSFNKFVFFNAFFGHVVFDISILF